MKPMDSQKKERKKSLYGFREDFLRPYGVRATGACLGFHVAPRYLGEVGRGVQTVAAVSNCNL